MSVVGERGGFFFLAVVDVMDMMEWFCGLVVVRGVMEGGR